MKTETIWVPSPTAVYEVVNGDEHGVYVRFTSLRASAKSSSSEWNHVDAAYYTLQPNGRLKVKQACDCRWGRDGLVSLNGLKLRYVAEWDDVKPKGSRTLDERLDACGDDFNEMWKILSVKSNRRAIVINLDEKSYGERFRPENCYNAYVHKDSQLGYVLTGAVVRYRYENMVPLSELDTSQVYRITVDTPGEGYWVWKRKEPLTDG